MPVRWIVVTAAVLGAVVLAVVLGLRSGGTEADPVTGELKATVPQLLTASENIGAMPDLAIGERDAWTRKRTSGAGLATLEAQVRSVWAPDQVREQVTQWIAGLRSVLGEDDYVPYDTSAFTVSRWKDVDVDGSRATVSLVGHEAFRVRGQWSREEDRTFALELRRTSPQTVSDPGWRLESVTVSDRPH